MHENGERVLGDESKVMMETTDVSQVAEQEETSEESDFQDLFEQTFSNIQEGEILSGKVVLVGKESVMVDVGYKSEGQIPIQEFMDEDGQVLVKEGDIIEVLLESRDDEEGEIVLSKTKADKIKVWEEIRKAYEEGTPVEGRIVGRVKGGLSVDIGVTAFLPGSQVDLRPVRNLEDYIGQTHRFRVLKYNRRRSNIVLSRRVLLEEERAKAREKTLAILQEGMILKGVVKNITEYGAFIDLGGVDGLLHITDMSWGRVKHPSDVVQIGQELEVKVLNFDRERERVSLGLKQLTPDPWLSVEEKYPIGSRLEGRVVSITDYGAFVELEPGVEGLVHVSEMSWTRRIRHPSKIVSVGDRVDVMVLNVDPQRRRISLGMKQVMPNPWVTVAEKYPVGTIIQGKIRNITEFGIFIGLDEGIDGMVHVSDISWTKRIRHPGEIYKKGQEVKAIVLQIDQENERFSLGIKQLEPDPWEALPEKYPVGSRVKGRVTSVTDFGVFLEIEEGIEGLIHISELSREKVKHASDVCKEGDEIEAMVIHLDPRERKIGLSVKALRRADEEADIQGYLASQRTQTPTIGALLRDELLKKAMESQRRAKSSEETRADQTETSEPEQGGNASESE
jgi:small subunit ribosomal protein S1